MTNTALLKADPSLLSGLDKQRAFLLQMALTPMTCPHCGSKVSQIAAHGNGEIDSFPVDSANDQEYACPACKIELHHVLPLIGSAFWMTKRAWDRRDQDNPSSEELRA